MQVRFRISKSFFFSSLITVSDSVAIFSVPRPISLRISILIVELRSRIKMKCVAFPVARSILLRSILSRFSADWPINKNRQQIRNQLLLVENVLERLRIHGIVRKNSFAHGLRNAWPKNPRNHRTAPCLIFRKFSIKIGILRKLRAKSRTYLWIIRKWSRLEWDHQSRTYEILIKLLLLVLYSESIDDERSNITQVHLFLITYIPCIDMIDYIPHQKTPSFRHFLYHLIIQFRLIVIDPMLFQSRLYHNQSRLLHKPEMVLCQLLHIHLVSSSNVSKTGLQRAEGLTTVHTRCEHVYQPNSLVPKTGDLP